MSSIEQLARNHFPCYGQTACYSFSFRWFASTIKMYSWLCPWLLTWSDYEEDYDDEGEEFDDAGEN
jgi:hypothetical protein